VNAYADPIVAPRSCGPSSSGKGGISVTSVKRRKIRFLFILGLVLCGLHLSFRESAADSVTVEVQGISGDVLRNVEAALAMPPGLVSKEGIVNTIWLDYFITQVPAKAQSALEPFGYYKSHIEASEVSEEGKHRIIVTVSPGSHISVSSLEVRVEGPGAAERSLTALAASFPLKIGNVLRQDVYEKAKGDLRTAALDLGYLGADFPVHSVTVSLAREEAEIHLVLRTGPQYKFGTVAFTGAPTYPEPFLRRFLTFHKGDIFSNRKIGETQLNLQNADRFKDVFIEADRTAAEELQVPVTIRLTQAPRRRLRIGGGYTTDLGPRFTLQYRDVNVLERGHEFNSELNLSERLQAISSNYIIPGATDTKSLTSFNLRFLREDVLTYTTRFASFEVERMWSLGKGRLAGVFVTALKEDSFAGTQSTNSFSIYPGVRFSARQFDDLRRPTKGYYYLAELRATHPAFGSETAFVQSILEGNVLVPLPGGFSIFLRSRVAATLQNDPTSDLPIPLRFFAGGDRSVRGYTYQSLGPKDELGDVVGGKNLFVASLQLERAVGRDWGILAFYDTGNAFNDFSQMDLAQGAGLGVRYYSPVGPIEVDVARQLGVMSPGYRIHFSIGFAL
jgi:translocation and assembly module TamA